MLVIKAVLKVTILQDVLGVALLGERGSDFASLDIGLALLEIRLMVTGEQPPSLPLLGQALAICLEFFP